MASIESVETELGAITGASTPIRVTVSGTPSTGVEVTLRFYDALDPSAGELADPASVTGTTVGGLFEHGFVFSEAGNYTVEAEIPNDCDVCKKTAIVSVVDAPNSVQAPETDLVLVVLVALVVLAVVAGKANN